MRRPGRRLTAVGLLLLLLAGGVLLPGLFRDDTDLIAGVAVVTDGDTLQVGGQRIRLQGIDAPESRQTCGRDGTGWACGAEATAALRSFLRGRDVACRVMDRDRFGRHVARCRVEGEDLGAWMVREGWALAYTRFTWRYLPQELAARLAGRGLWSGSFERPEDWRARNSR